MSNFLFLTVKLIQSYFKKCFFKSYGISSINSGGLTMKSFEKSSVLELKREKLVLRGAITNSGKPVFKPSKR